MARITPDDVLDGGFETDLSTQEVGEVLDDAHLLVEERLGSAGYTDARLDKIEKYLTRHLIRFEPDRQIESGQGASTRLSFSGNFDHEGLQATSPGQTVLLLDEESALGSSDDRADFEVY